MSMRKRALASLMSQNPLEDEKVKDTARKMAMENFDDGSELRWNDSMDDKGNELLVTKDFGDGEDNYLGESKKDLEKLQELIDIGDYSKNLDLKKGDEFKNFSKELLRRKIDKSIYPGR